MIDSITHEKIPFFLGLLLSTLGIQYNYLATHFVDSPILEYQWFTEEKVSEEGGIHTHFTLGIKNLSESQSFEDVSLDVKWKYAQEQTKLVDPRVVSYSPASLHWDAGAASSGRLLNFTLKTIQPGNYYELSFRVQKALLPGEHPSLYLGESSVPVRLRKASFETFLFRNQFGINLTITILLVLVVAFYLLKISSQIKKLYPK